MRFRVPPRVRCTSSLALPAAASWLSAFGRCLRLPAVSLVRRGDQVAALQLRADQAALSADFPGIDDPAGVLNGGDRARIPCPTGMDGVAVSESAPRISQKKSRFRLQQNISSDFAGDLRLVHWGSNSLGSVHRAQAVGIGSRRTLIPTAGPLTPLTELVGSGRLKGNSKHLPERKAPPQRDAETDDHYGYLIWGVVDGKGTGVRRKPVIVGSTTLRT
jgi:hypothetical protein